MFTLFYRARFISTFDSAEMALDYVLRHSGDYTSFAACMRDWRIR